jgi:RNA polymerase sigma factor (sigma-70 family)
MSTLTEPDRRPVGPDDHAMLLRAAAAGDTRAWSVLVRRYGPVIASVARRHRLHPADRDEVAQRTWLRLIEHIGAVREPAAIGGWLATVARRECLRVLAASRCEMPVEEPQTADTADMALAEDRVMEVARKEALYEALERLPEHQERLLRTLLAKPDVTYLDLSTKLGMPHGSIGPTRARALARLRRDRRFADAIDGHVDRRTLGPSD